MVLRRLLLTGICVLLAPVLASAQELRIANGSPTAIDKPEAYRAYYGKLEGEPDVFTIHAEDAFRLSLHLLAPHVEGARTDFSATIVDTAQPGQDVAVLDGTMSEWTPFFDSAGRDDYLAGPPLRGGMAAGDYEIRVSNPGNQGAYVLLVGEKSGILPSGVISRYSALPAIKADFFGKPSYQAFMTPLLLRPIIVALIVLAGLVFAAYISQRRRMRAI